MHFIVVASAACGPHRTTVNSEVRNAETCWRVRPAGTSSPQPLTDGVLWFGKSWDMRFRICCSFPVVSSGIACGGDGYFRPQLNKVREGWEWKGGGKFFFAPLTKGGRGVVFPSGRRRKSDNGSRGLFGDRLLRASPVRRSEPRGLKP